MNHTKGIILVGGLATRLYPVGKVISKHLLPIYNKPMIYYPLSVLMLSGIRDILIITKPEDLKSYQSLLGNGSTFGVKLSYLTQNKPDGLAQALLIGENFLGKSNCLFILGDNFFYGNKLFPIIERILGSKKSYIFSYFINDPSDFGVVEFDKKKNIKKIHEKPKKKLSNYVITGMYYYPNGISKLTKNLKLSKRNELEITDLNKVLLKKGKLNCINLGRGITWLDTGTFDNLLSAAQFVKVIENRQGSMIACLEEIALNNNWISKSNLSKQVKKMKNSEYKRKLENLLKIIE